MINKKSTLSLTVTLMVFCNTLLVAYAGADNGGDELLVNPRFESGSIEPGWELAHQWVKPEQVRVVRENGQTFLRIATQEPGSIATVQRVPLGDDIQRIYYSGRVRGVDIRPDEQNWTGGRLGLQYLNDEGKRTGGWPSTIRVREDTDGWVEFSYSDEVPEDAEVLFVEAGLWRTTGQMDFADLSIRAERGERLTGEARLETRFQEVLAEFEDGPLPLDANQIVWGMRPIPDPQPVTGAPDFDESSFDVDWRIAPEGGDFSTFAEALSEAQKRLAGGLSVRIRVAPGTYRERALELKAHGQAARDALLVIEAENPGAAILSGSTVYEDWEQVRSGVWKTTLHEPIGESANAWGDFRRREMVFVDGEFIPQVAHPGELEPGTFAVSEDDKDILLHLPAGRDPRALKVEIADFAGHQRTPLLEINKPNVILRGLVLQHGNQHLHNAFALRIESNTLVEDCAVRWNNSAALAVRGENVTLRNSDFSDNGGKGLFAWRARNHLIEGCKTNRNNWRGLQAGRTSWSQAGIKYHYVEHILIRDHEANDNHSPGIWFDLWCYHVTLDNVQMNRNSQEMGLYWEVARHLTVRNSQINGNAEGFRLHDAGGVRFINCSFHGNVVAVTIYGSPPAPNGGTTRADNHHSGDNAGRFMGVGDVTFDNCSFKANADADFVERVAPRISGFIAYVNPGYPTFFWATSHNLSAVPFFATLDVQGSTFDSPVPRPFRNPMGEAITRTEWDAARQAGWPIGDDWGTALGADGTHRFQVRPGSVHQALPGFSAPAGVIPLMSVHEEGGTAFLRVDKPLDPSFRRIKGYTRLPVGTETVRVTTTTRMPSFQHGPRDWQRARLEMRFFDNDYNQIGGMTEMNWDQETPQWRSDSRGLTVPEGAKVLRLDFRFHGHGAVFDIRGVEVEAVK